MPSIYDPPPRPGQRPVSKLVWWLLGLALSCPACGAIGFFTIRSQTPYDAAVERATNDPRVQQLLGAPVSADTLFSGQTSFKKSRDDQGTLRVRLEGSEHTGILEAAGVRTGGVWGFSTLRVTSDSGRTVSLVRGD